jgi:hypothetical protein
MKKKLTLYSTMLPLWFILLLPNTWLFLIATQFIVVSLVLFASLKYIDYKDPSIVWRKSIIWNTLYGFIAYLFMCLFFLVTHIIPENTVIGNWFIKQLAGPLNVNPFSSLISILYVVIGLILSGILIYYANKKLAFRGSNLTAEQKHKVCLCLAIFSAPYITLFPSYLLYQ